MGRDRIIAVTGTPGTGKSTFSKKLSEELNLELVDLNEFIDQEKIFEIDSEGTKLVSSEELQNAFEKVLKENDQDLVIDGLLSHLLSPEQITHVVVLRTKPQNLRDRLSERDFTQKKVEENVEAEAIGVVTTEAVEEHGVKNVFEIDNTEMYPEETVETFKKALNDEKTLEPGSVDWLEEYFENKLE